MDRSRIRWCLLNPKAYVFMVAVFPQFVRPEGAPLGVQGLAMALIVVANQFLVYGAVAAGAGGVRDSLLRNERLQVVTARCVAVLLVGTAAWTLAMSWVGA